MSNHIRTTHLPKILTVSVYSIWMVFDKMSFGYGGFISGTSKDASKPSVRFSMKKSAKLKVKQLKKNKKGAMILYFTENFSFVNDHYLLFVSWSHYLHYLWLMIGIDKLISSILWSFLQLRTVWNLKNRLEKFQVMPWWSKWGIRIPFKGMLFPFSTPCSCA